MKDHRLKFGCAAAALALFGCGETGAESLAPKASRGGLTIELPEPKEPPPSPAEPDQQKPDPGPEEAMAKEAPPPVAKAPPKAKEPEPPVIETPAPEASPELETPPLGEEASPLPLPRAVVARTIERIGYPCGGVASSSRIGPPGGETAYRITCTSGDTYRASNRSGRFRFRKVGG